MSAAPAPPAVQRRPRYLAIARVASQQAIAYRMTTLSSIIAHFIWVAILYALWHAAFAGRDRIEDYSWGQMRTYILLAYGINALLGFPTVARMMYAIRTGDIVVDLIRPLNYLHTQLATAAGHAMVESLISLTLTLLLGLIVFNIVPPASPAAALLFAVSLLIGFVTKYLVAFLVSLLCFWTINSVGLNWAQAAITSVLSGALVPIAFLPSWLQPLAEWSPLRGIVATPVGFYLGQYGGVQLALVLGAQIGWLIVLWIAADRAWPRAFRAVDTQGG